MIRIEVDMFSGRPNPVWILTDPAATKSLLDSVAESADVTTKPGAGFTGLGFREVRVDLLGDDEARRKGVPSQFALASIAAKNLKRSGALAQRVIETMPQRSEIRLAQHELAPLDSKLREVVLKQLRGALAQIRHSESSRVRFPKTRCGRRSRTRRATSANTK